MAGFIDEIKKGVSKIQETAKDMLDKTDIDEKIVAAAKDLAGKAKDALDKTDVDDKIIDAAKGLKDKASEVLKAAEPKAKDAMDKLQEEATEQFEKIRAAAKGTDPIHDFMNRQSAPAEEPAEAPAEEPVEAPAEEPEEIPEEDEVME